MTKQLVIYATAVMTTMLALVMLWQFRIVVIYVLISLTVAAAMRPFVHRLIGRSFMVRMSWILLYMLILGGFASLLFLAGRVAINEIQQLTQAVSIQNEWRLPKWLTDGLFHQTWVARLPLPSKLFEAVIGNEGQLVLPTLFGATKYLGSIASGLLIIPFLSLYWSTNQVHFERLWLSLLPSEQRKNARGIWRTIETDLGAYIRSEAVQSLLAVVLLGLGYWVLRSPYPMLLALSGALAWLIPVAGAAVAIILPLSMGLMTDVQLGLYTTVYTLIVLLVLQLWVEPHLFRRKWDNPILTLVILLAMANAFGLLGIMIAPPISAICQIFWSRLVSSPGVSESAAHVTDLIERQARLLHRIQDMEGSPPALVTSSMDRLAQLIAKAELILHSAPIVEPSDSSLNLKVQPEQKKNDISTAEVQ